MHSVSTSFAWLPLLAVAAGAWPQQAGAQAFLADYGLASPATAASEPDARYRAGLINVGAMSISPAIRADAGFSGAGLSLAAGRNWFAQVAVGRSLQTNLPVSSVNSSDALSIGGGYRWGDGQSMSLQVTGARGPDRLGLAVRYDWPRYFVRLSYDSRINLVPTDTVRFSAGVRF
ncbi:MAG: hypothetical protein JWQ07_753 [Ramlibacter sp.]|nr:hypothetical protein [Ramlibacter sp.]